MPGRISEDRDLIEGNVRLVRDFTGCENWPSDTPDTDGIGGEEMLAAWAFVQGYAAAHGITTEALLETFDLHLPLFATLYLVPGADVDVLYQQIEAAGIEVAKVDGHHALNIHCRSDDRRLGPLVERVVAIIGRSLISEIPDFPHLEKRQRK